MLAYFNICFQRLWLRPRLILALNEIFNYITLNFRFLSFSVLYNHFYFILLLLNCLYNNISQRHNPRYLIASAYGSLFSIDIFCFACEFFICMYIGSLNKTNNIWCIYNCAVSCTCITVLQKGNVDNLNCEFIFGKRYLSCFAWFITFVVLRSSLQWKQATGMFILTCFRSFVFRKYVKHE